MPNPSDAFYEGQGIPVALAEVEDELDKLWGPAAEKTGGPELESPAVTRVALANLVLVDLGPVTARLDATIAAITAHYPSRLIVLRPSRAGDVGNRRVAAEVAAQCHLPTPGRPQVCSELIALRAAPEDLDLLPSAVRSLAEGDLHSILWWFDDPSQAPALLERLADGSTRLILDRPDPAGRGDGLLDALDLNRYPHVRDIAWFGITPWRELISQLFDPPVAADLGRIAAVRVRAEAAVGDRIPRAAAWLVAWLAGQLGWERGEGEATGGSLEATLRSPGGPVAVRIDAEAAPVGPFARISCVEIDLRATDDHPAGTLKLRRAGADACAVDVEGADRRGSALPRLVLAAEYDAERRVAAALETDRNDPPFRRALPVALWLLGLG